MMLACASAANARSWRYYGYHWGHTWSNPDRGHGDESRAEDKSDLRNRVGDFGSAIERMIRACDQQVVELKKCRSIPFLESSSRLRINVKPWSRFKVWR
jgi:hypothetical protein